MWLKIFLSYFESFTHQERLFCLWGQSGLVTVASRNKLRAITVTASTLSRGDSGERKSQQPNPLPAAGWERWAASLGGLYVIDILEPLGTAAWRDGAAEPAGRLLEDSTT